LVGEGDVGDGDAALEGDELPSRDDAAAESDIALGNGVTVEEGDGAGDGEVGKSACDEPEHVRVERVVLVAKAGAGVGHETARDGEDEG
jgi:hypothetical protein